MALEIFSDMSERVNYNLPGFPVYARKGELCYFDRYTVACHWHPDLEFIFVLDGSMEYFVNGEIIKIKKGEGIFVNSKRLHYNYSKDFSNCIFLVVVVHPSLLGDETPVCSEYFKSKFGSENEDYIFLTNHTNWQNEALMLISNIYDEIHRKTNNPLRLIAQSASLCANISENIQTIKTSHTEKHLWLTIWNMTGYIQKNYANKMTIDDIAIAGSICRSKCFRLFNKYVGQTPTVYLTRYRINKSCEMLRDTNMPIIEISMACGFQNASYFTQIFQKEIGLNPREYRRQNIQVK